MRSCASALLAAAGLVAATATIAGAGETASTTRIETRPFYGATVTLEEGVRVFRPLPPHNRIIINPGAKASLSLGFEENVTKNYNYNQSSSSSSSGSGGASPVYGAASVAAGGAGRPRGGHRPGGVPAGPVHVGKGHH